MPGPRSRRLTDGLMLGVILLVAAGLRVVAAFDEPWLDELWSRHLARQATSTWAVLTAPELHIDNNHWLNTMYLCLLGDTAAWWPQRVPAVAGGVATVLFVWLIGRRFGRATASVAAGITAVGFVFVQYGSEARGYGPAAGLATAAVWLVIRFAGRRGWGRAAPAFGFICAAGLLAHATFVYALAGAAVALPIIAHHAGRRGGRLVGECVAWLAGPAAFGAALYVVAVRGLRIGGGPRYGLGRVLADAFTYTAGLPTPAAAGWLAAACAAATAGFGLWELRRTEHGEWVALAIAGWVAPAVTLIVRPDGPLYPRYFFVALPFVALPVAAAGVAVWRRGPSGRVIAVVAAAALLLGNGTHLQRFYAAGRGQNRRMAEFIAAETPGPTVTLATAQRFRLATVLDYTWPRGDVRGKTYAFAGPADAAPQWVVLDRDEPGGPTQPVLRVAPWPDAFRLVTVLPHYGLSGCDWLIYRRIEVLPPPNHKG